MKKLFFLIAVLFLGAAAIPTAPPTHASAEEEIPLYAVADDSDVWFYTEPNEESGLFLIPYTYYVLVLSRGETFCAVRYLEDVAPYQAVTGYCKTEQLTFVDFVPSRPWLKKQLTVSYRLESAAGGTMGNGSFDVLEKTFLYYGTSYSGTARYYYVLADGVFDYIPAIEDVDYELNTDYQTVVVSEPVPEPEETANVSALQIIVASLAIAAVVVIAVFVLRGKKTAPQDPEF